MTTRFALHALDILMPDSVTITLWFDGNSKVTRDNGIFDEPAANAFSLVQVKDCPFATETCKGVCYVNKLEKNEVEIHEKYKLNSEAIRLILGNREYLETARVAVARYISDNCPDGFRWHVSGDIFSMSYSIFIWEVCFQSPDVMHWIYTRSFDYLAPLLGVSNLVVNLSCDKDNWKMAKIYVRRFGLRPCYLTVDGSVPDDLPDDAVIFPAYNLRARDPVNDDATGWMWFNLVLTSREKRMVCPADYFGQSERFRCGICNKCLKLFKF